VNRGGKGAAQRCPPHPLRFSPAARPPACLQDTFFKQLRTAPDGFSLVADYFGKGLMNHTSVSTSAAASL